MFAGSLQVLEDAAGAEWHVYLVGERVRRDGLRHRQVLGRPEDGGVVADVAAEQDKGRWIDGRARQAAQVSNRVAGGVEEVERPVSEIVQRGKLPYSKLLWTVKADFAKGSISTFPTVS